MHSDGDALYKVSTVLWWKRRGKKKKKERRKYNEQGKKKINRRARETHREPESMVWYTASRRSSNAHAVNETTTHFGLHQRIIQVGRLLERGKISKLKDLFFFLSLSFFLVHVVSQKKKTPSSEKKKDRDTSIISHVLSPTWFILASWFATVIFNWIFIFLSFFLLKTVEEEGNWVEFRVRLFKYLSFVHTHRAAVIPWLHWSPCVHL